MCVYTMKTETETGIGSETETEESSQNACQILSDRK